jgi:hypothetical protein
MPISEPIYEFTKEGVDRAPPGPGVYVLYVRGEVIYYGEAHDGTIIGRLRKHLSGAEGGCTQAATHFAFALCPDPESREAELLQEFEVSNGRLPRCNERAT